MEVGIQRTDSNRLQANGPRVSFNRDVHVKRIGTRLNEKENYPVQTTNLQPPQNYQPLRRELPTDLSEEGILKEAALVLAQAERVKCKVEGGDKLNDKSKKNPKINIPNQFHSLPSRKKNSTKPVSRSVSDASSKKPKKPSIFNIFSRKSDPSLDQIDSQDQKFKDINKKRVNRSKSDVGTTKDRKTSRKRNNSENEETTVNQVKPSQLSPIIENAQREDYFTEKTEKSGKSEKTDKTGKSEKIDERKINIKTSPSTIIVNEKSRKSPPVAGNIGYTNQEDLDLIPTKPIGENLKDTIQSLNTHSKSIEDMHSSQQPVEKLPLTKGLTVDGMVKRLSMERFSPPPHISGPAFSYTRPNEQVIYAQVVCDTDNKDKQQLRISPSPKTMDLSNRYYNSNDNYDRDYHRSVIEKKSDYPSQNNKTEVYISQNFDSNGHSYSPNRVTKIWGVNSSPYRNGHHRNLSDDDEGLGFEPRKYFEEEIPAAAKIKIHEDRYYDNRRSPTEEPPIIPVIRSLSPINVRIDTTDRGRADGMDSRRREGFREPFNDLSYRREALESKIQSRRFGSIDRFDHNRKSPIRQYNYSPERLPDYRNDKNISPTFRTTEIHDRYLTPERETTKFHKLNSNEILKKYSPERTHLDMISPSRDMKTSTYVHTKYYDDGTGGVKETYRRETEDDGQGEPHIRESRRKERLNSPRRSKDPEIQYRTEPQDDSYHIDYEPRNYEPQHVNDFHRSSPENYKKHETVRKSEEHWQHSLNRDKRNQRSFDKGDSGIENDFRKESFNSDLTSKWRKRTYQDDITSCELFIKKERRHTEELYPQRRKYDIIYRERSIDDGSHFDPRLDKYSKDTIRKKSDRNMKYSSPNGDSNGTLKREKKVGSLEKMKLLFSGSGRKKTENKVIKEKPNPSKDPRYLVHENEMRSRYHEHRGVMIDLREPAVPKTITDIATRRRLSTPKASPLLKRSSSEKNSKPSPLSVKDNSTKAEKSGWFKSLDRRSKKKVIPSQNYDLPPHITVTEDEVSALPSKDPYRNSVPPSAAEKNLRFFGDTDYESNPSFSRAASTPRTRPTVMKLNRDHKHSQSAYHLDRISKPNGNKPNPRSSSLQNLDEDIDEVDRPRNSRQYSYSRNLDNISESGSDTEIQNEYRHSSTPKKTPSPRGNENIMEQKYKYYEDNKHSRSRERTPLRENIDTTRIEFRKPPAGPPKPARTIERRQTYSREREPLHDSSGTEGDSSLQSQRSVVYLHATTVGAIPQPHYISSRRRALSREDVSKEKAKEKLQPMTKTVSRSVSMLAPWKPKHISEGYEINYSQETPEKPKKYSTISRNSTSTSKTKKTTTLNGNNTISRSRKNVPSKDDQSSSIRNTTITSKSDLSSSQHKLDKKYSDHRKDTISRRKVK